MIQCQLSSLTLTDKTLARQGQKRERTAKIVAARCGCIMTLPPELLLTVDKSDEQL